VPIELINFHPTPITPTSHCDYQNAPPTSPGLSKCPLLFYSETAISETAISEPLIISNLLIIKLFLKNNLPIIFLITIFATILVQVETKPNFFEFFLDAA
jgi:hypothetical protein